MNGFRPITRIVALLMAGAVALAACGGTDTVITVDPQAASEALAANPDAVLLDIRTPEEVAEARIAGALNIDFYAPDFRDQIADLDRDATYIVYCRSGSRSSQAESLFADLGFNDVRTVDGGIIAWFEAGLPLER